MGKCPDCGAWDGLERYVETAEPAAAEHSPLAAAWTAEADEVGRPAGGTARARPLPEVESADVRRMPSGIGEFDRVLGGGFVPGSVTLLGGEPGIGKSTLLLEAAAAMARGGRRVLYVSSEESAYQTRLRAERLFDPGGGAGADAEGAMEGLGNLFVLAETSLSRIVEQAKAVRPALLVLDSIQMVFKADLEASPGSVAQLRRCCTELVYLAKVSSMAVALVGHVTKDGQLAGPKLLEHLVDTVLTFEGDRHHAHRVVRGIKNRFGTTLEVGLFEMTGSGLREVRDPGALADPAAVPPPGSALCPVLHGTRCLMVEIQALTAPGFPGSAKRKTSGFDANRLAMIIAVLEQHGGLRLADQDIFTSAVGGLKVVEPAADLALCLAVAGEVGLGGEVRHVRQIEQRVTESVRRGYRRVVAGAVQAGAQAGGAEIIGVSTVGDALALLESSHRRSSPLPAPGPRVAVGPV
jgi:DNA repair protein RadA/Sms